MRLKFLIVVLATISITGCKKDSSSSKSRIEVNVQSVTQTSLSGTTVQLLSDENKITYAPLAQAQSNGNGQVYFDVTAGKNYYLFHPASDGKVLANEEATYIVTGKFASQLQIDSSPVQTPAAKIGDDIRQDINGDGKIDKYDMVLKFIVLAGDTKKINFVLK
jgi:hypothetical protein